VRFRSTRDGEAAAVATRALGEAARGMANLVPFILRAVKARATLGEIADALRAVFGEYRPS
jgi:methylmalonyl-CoA mutase N-terminal domain/subunit